MKLTVVIPGYSVGTLCPMTAMHAAEWKKQCDELIICEDGPYCEELHRIADLYILHPNYGVCDNMNLGWQIALSRGADYVAIMDSDVRYVEGSLRDMCIPGQVTAPTITQHPDTVSVAPMLCVPKEVAQERGFYDSRGGAHRMKHFDADYHVRVQDILTKVKSLKVDHPGGATTSQFFKQCDCGVCNN